MTGESEIEGDCADSKDIATQLFDQMEAGVVDFAAGGRARDVLPRPG